MADFSTFKIIIDITTAFGVFIAAVALIINIRSNFIAVMSKCIADYRRIIRDMQTTVDNKDKEILKLDLLGLFNEQCIILKNGTFPK